MRRAEGHKTDGGVYVIDIHNPSLPREIGFIEAHQDTLGAGRVQALHVDTPKFNGDVLVNEPRELWQELQGAAGCPGTP